MPRSIVCQIEGDSSFYSLRIKLSSRLNFSVRLWIEGTRFEYHHCTMRFLLWRSVNRKIYQNVFLTLHFHFHFLICLIFPGNTFVKTTKNMIIISKVFFHHEGLHWEKSYFGLFFCKYFFLNLTKISPFSDPPFSIFHKKITKKIKKFIYFFPQ